MGALNPDRLLRFVVRLAFAFCAALLVAHGANALGLTSPGDDLVVLVAFGAVGFLTVDVGWGAAVLQCILCGGYALQVLRVHAVAIAAGVVHHQPLPNFTKHAEPCGAVSAAGGPTEEEAAIAVTIKWPSPQPARADYLVFGCEAVCFGLSKVFHALIVAKCSQGDKGGAQWCGA